MLFWVVPLELTKTPTENEKKKLEIFVGMPVLQAISTSINQFKDFKVNSWSLSWPQKIKWKWRLLCSFCQTSKTIEFWRNWGKKPAVKKKTFSLKFDFDWTDSLSVSITISSPFTLFFFFCFFSNESVSIYSTFGLFVSKSEN